MFWEAVDQVARELDQSGLHRESVRTQCPDLLRLGRK